MSWQCECGALGCDKVEYRMIVFRMRTFEEIWKTSSHIELPGLGLLRPSRIGYSPFEPSYTSSSRQPERSHYLNECTLESSTDKRTVWAKLYAAFCALGREPCG